MRLFIILLALVWSLPAFAETAVERIERTKTVNCGYIPYEPYIIKNPNTGYLNGIVIEYVNDVAKNHGLKVEWLETNIDQAVAALESGRIDAFCIPAAPDYNWRKVIEYTAPFGALPYYLYVPDNSTLTKDDLQSARFVIADGFAMSDITKMAFPKATYVSIPQTSSPAEMYDQLRYGKADAIINEHASATNYMTNNPKTIRRVSDDPIMVLRMFMNTKKGDAAMGDFLTKNFGANQPDNQLILAEKLAKYKLPDGAYWLNGQCKNSAANDKGWIVCTR